MIAGDPTVLDDLDVLWAATLSFSEPQGVPADRPVLQACVDQGNALVGRGAAGFNVARGLGLLTATAQSGNGNGDGIVAVDTPADSVFAAHPQDYAFVYPAVSFVDLGANTKAEQSYAAGNPLLAGHWRARASPTAHSRPLATRRSSPVRRPAVPRRWCSAPRCSSGPIRREA